MQGLCWRQGIGGRAVGASVARLPRALFIVTACLVGGAQLSGCGGSVEGDDESMGGASADGGTGGSGDTGGNSSGGFGLFPTGGGPGSGASGGDFQEQECPDEPPPPVELECDPIDPSAGCPDGQGCYPYLEYPFGERCAYSVSGAFCAEASEGGQGEPCGNGQGYCSPGFMCVVGGPGGTRCAQICPTEGDSGCPEGLLCGSTDVQGYGVCF